MKIFTFDTTKKLAAGERGITIDTHRASIADDKPGVEVGLAEARAEIRGIQTQLTDIKADQRQQDNRFFGLCVFIATSAVGIAAKLAKLY